MKKNIFLLALAIIFSVQLLTAQNFITQWNLATAGSGATQLTIGTETSGTANYTWQQVPTGASGSGSWSGATLNITGLPAGAIIRLQITPANFRRIVINFGVDRNRLTQVEVWGSTAWSSMAGAFYGCTNLQVTATDVPDLSGVNSMAGMFYGCTNLNSPANINTWNTVAVTDMSNMFRGASAFNQNIGLWNTAAVTNMAFMFYEASAFNNGGNNSIANWNTAAVTDIIYMFKGASAFNQNIGSWNITAVTDMQGMFQEASAFNNGGSGSINNWSTAAVTNMFLMFQSASAFNQNISSWNTSAVTDLSYMFQGASAFNQNISSWNTAAVTNMALMFNSASAFNQNIGSWNTAAVTDMNNMFNGANAFNQNIGTWTLNPAVDLSGLLDNSGLDCNNYSAILIGWNTNPSTPNGRNLGAAGRQYGTNAAAARTNLTGAKGWTITGDAPSGSSCIIILPVTWLYVKGQLQNGNAIIKWATASERNTHKFEIEYSTNGINYSKIGNIATASNSNITQRYEFLHTSAAIGKNYYRIKQIDLDGRFTYSAVIVLDNLFKKNVLISPNPVQQSTTVYFKEPGRKTIRLLNANGQLILEEQVQQGNNRYNLNMGNLPAGIFILQVQMGNEKDVHKIIKQ